MKKLLALVLSLIMIMTSVFIVPFSAQAEQYPIFLYPEQLARNVLQMKVNMFQEMKKAELIIHIIFQVQVHFD